MSNMETAPREVVCTLEADTADVEVLTPRDVPLGGIRAMNVRRTLPQKRRSLIGAWCFLDHYGPDLVSQTAGMEVPRHPHTGLATVSWLFSGKIAHRDSAGFEAIVRPGEVNLMIAGRGISHQEFSTPDTTLLHGAQLWFALPESTRNMPPTFEHYAPEPVIGDGTEVRVFIGSLAGSTSPINTRTPPLLGAEAVLRPGSRLELDLDPGFEHGILLDTGDLRLDGAEVPVDHLVYLSPGRGRVVLEAGHVPARVLLIGGEPLGEQIIMWWNFVGRSHDEIVAYRAAWQAEIDAEPAPEPAGGTYPDGAPYPRFGPYPEGMPAPLPAPTLPTVQLRPRG
jgi:redox-sensitive bicupin YhaK (pirin superfamily)